MLSSSDILLKLSAPSSGSGNTQEGFPGFSWGNFMSTTVISSEALNNIFPDISGAQNLAGQVDYACVFVHNSTPTSSAMINGIAWLPLQLYTGSTLIAMAADPAGVVSDLSFTPQAVRITSAITAPPGVTGWISPVSTVPNSGNGFANGIQLGTLAPHTCCALWIRRTAVGQPAQNDLQFNLTMTFSSS